MKRMPPNSKLRLFDLTMIVIGLVIGMGIFRTSKDAAGAALTPSIYFFTWIFGGLIAICGALTYAEIGSRLPVTGAYYRIFSYAYHPSVAFALNIGILVSNAATVGAVALIGSGYLLNVFVDVPSQWMLQAVAVAAILLFFFINLKGLRLSSNAQNILMIIKILMLLLIISAIFYPPVHNTVNVPLLEKTNEAWSSVVASFGLALVAVSFSYGGYQQAINFGNEVNHPRKYIPAGIVSGIIMIIILYMLVNLSYYLVVGFNDMKETGEIASVVIHKMFGSAGATAFSLLLFLSVLAYVNVSLLSNPRVMFAMSEDGALPEIFSRKDIRNGVYRTSLAFFAATGMLVVFFAETFERILSFTIFLDCFGMAAAAATIFRLRKQTKELDDKVYKMKLFPVLPILYILTYIFVGLIISINYPYIALTALGVLAGSGMLYFIIRRK